jgi:hypothetical protein
MNKRSKRGSMIAAQRVLDDPIAKRCGADLAPLRFLDVKMDVGPRAVAATLQIAP